MTANREETRAGDDASVRNSDVSAPENVDAKCGYRKCTPDCLQPCAKPTVLLATLCSLVLVEAFVQWGLINICMTSWERRYNLGSTQAAWIVTTQDITAALFSPPVGYMTAFWEKSQMISAAVVAMTIGSFLFLVPQLASGVYELGVIEGGTLCYAGANFTHDPCEHDISSTNQSYWLAVFIIAQILFGYTGGCLWTIGITYIDDNCKHEDSPLYLGIYNAASALGATIGFIGGGMSLKIYVDVLKVDMDSIYIDSSDPRWVGAWWIGFLAAFIISIPLMFLLPCFPPQLPAAVEYLKSKKSQSYKGKGIKETEKEDYGKSCTDLKHSMKIVLCNPVFIMITVSGLVEIGSVTAFAAFLPKIIQFQFGQTASIAALIAGAALVPGAILGQLLGGIIPKCLHLSLKALMWMFVICAYACVLFTFGFLARCQSAAMAGYDADYSYNSSVRYNDSFTNDCNYECNCTTLVFEPICGTDGLSYFSPCHAACRFESEIDGKKVYGDCTCVLNSTQTPFQAENGVCTVECPQFWVFMALLLMVIICSFIQNTAGYSILMRVVPEKQRSFALGVQSPIIKFLGSVPFPLLFGVIFDQSCRVWQDNCGSRGSCWIYDNDSLAIGTFLTAFIVKVVSGTCFLVVVLIYKPPPPEVVNEITVDKQNDDLTSGVLNDGFGDISPSEIEMTLKEDEYNTKL